VKAAEGRLLKPETASTKECNFCFEVVPIKATRCKACTSELA
jgi:predicted Zn-ribbon and HTH transcriptional regulator